LNVLDWEWVWTRS